MAGSAASRKKSRLGFGRLTYFSRRCLRRNRGENASRRAVIVSGKKTPAFGGERQQKEAEREKNKKTQELLSTPVANRGRGGASRSTDGREFVVHV